MNQPISPLREVEACVFDAYGTLFDVASVTRAAQDAVGDGWQALSDLWRAKQLQYTWLRGLAGHHADFAQVTAEALDFALASLRIDAGAGLRERLLASYLRIAPYAEVPDTLRQLKAAGWRLAILSNGSPPMLAAAVANAGLDGLFEAVLSVEEVGVFKPHPAVYRLAGERLGLPPEKICFLSANGWDAFSAKAFGFRVLWCNRFGQPPERIPARPDGEIPDLAALPARLAAAG
ncbi:MAG TPA: haloacid dehalogenase type II [Azospira sp.]|nr:haloacid dehalogenase type II [Azospira sp.]